MAIACTQSRYRFRTDALTVDSGSAVWGAAENTTWVPTPIQHGVPFRIRFEVYNNGSTSTGAVVWRIFAQKNGAGGYTAVTSARADGVQTSTAASTDADNAALTISRLTNDATPGTPTWVNGQIDRTGATGNITLAIGSTNAQVTEIEFCLVLPFGSSQNGDFFDFRVYRATSTVLETYSVTPRVSVTQNSYAASNLATGAAGLDAPALVQIWPPNAWVWSQANDQVVSGDSFTTGSSFTIPSPSGAVTGDLILCAVIINHTNISNGAPLSDPGAISASDSGWTVIEAGPITTSFNGTPHYWVGFRTAGVSEPANYTFTNPTTPSLYWDAWTNRFTPPTGGSINFDALNSADEVFFTTYTSPTLSGLASTHDLCFVMLLGRGGSAPYTVDARLSTIYNEQANNTGFGEIMIGALNPNTTNSVGGYTFKGTTYGEDGRAIVVGFDPKVGGAVSIASAQAAFDTPLLQTKYTFSETSITSAADVLGPPAFNVSRNLSATSIASSAASIGQSKISVAFTALSLASNAAGLDQPATSFPDVPVVRSISTLAYGSRTNATIIPPAGIVDNDILLAYIVNIQIGSEANTAIGAASGFTQIGSDQVVNSGSTFLRGAVFWKRASNESGNYTFTTASGNSEAVLIAISGAVPSGLVDVSTQSAGSIVATSTTAGSTQNINATAASITTRFPDDLTIYLSSAFSGYSSTAPVGINPLLNDIQNGVIFAGWGPEPNSGTTTGALSMQVNSSANVWLAYLIGIQSDVAFDALSATSLSAGSDAFGSPAIVQAGGLVAVSIASASAGIIKPVFNQGDILAAQGLAAGSVAFSLPLLGCGSLNATSLTSIADAFGTPALTTKYAFSATTLAVGAAGLGQPVFNQKDVLTATAIASVAAKLGTPLYGTRNLSAVSLAGQSAVIQTTSYNQSGAGFATPISSAAAGIGAPLIVQTEILQDAIDLTTSAPNSGSPTLGWALSANSLATTGAAFTLPAIKQKHVLVSATMASATATLGIPALNQSVFGLATGPSMSQPAGFSVVSLSQPLNALVATDLASQAARVPTILWADANKGFASATNYVTTAPTLDSAAPNLTLTAAFNLGVPTSLASKADTISKPALNQKQVLPDAISIASAGIALDLPQFVQFNALTAADLAAGAAGIPTPGIGDTSALLAGELNFVSVDSNVHQINKALTGIVPVPAIAAVANVAMQVNAAATADDFLKAVAAIAIGGRTVLRGAAAWTITERLALVTKAAFALGQTLLSSDATVAFIIPPWTAITSLQADSNRLLVAASAASIAAAIAPSESLLIQTGLSLTSNTALYVDIVKPLPQAWDGSALLSPEHTFAAVANQVIRISAALQPSATLRVSTQINIGASGLSPVTTLRALGKMRMTSVAAISPAVVAAISTNMLLKANVPLAGITSAEISSLLLSITGASLNSDTELDASLVRPSLLALNYSAELGLVVSEALRLQALAPLNQEASVNVSEVAQLGPKSKLVPASILGAKLQKVLSPITLWGAQVSFATNERILPAGTAFYFVSPRLAINEYQILRPTVPVALQTKLISHEGLRMLQSPMVLRGSAGLSSGDYSVHGPVLQLASDIILDIDGMSNTAATRSNFSNDADLENQIALWQSLESEIENQIAMRSMPRVAMAGLSGLSPGCFIDPDVTLQHTVEISSMITAQKSQNRIVAQGNLLRKYI